MNNVGTMSTTPPRRTPDAQPAQLKPTSLSKGSGSRQSEHVSISGADTQDDYNIYLEHDIQTEQELSFEDFMEHILNRPNFSSEYSSKIDQIAKDTKFIALLADYPKTGRETDYYHPFVLLSNRVLQKNNSKHHIAFCRNDPTLISGSAGKRKPDVIAALREVIFDPQTRISDDNCKNSGPEEFPFHWAELFAYVEFKKPNSDAAQPPAKEKKVSSASASRTQKGNKRSAEVDSGVTGNKRARTGPPKVKVQCVSYALEMLSNGGLRTHVLGLLVTKDKLQLLYFDRSIFIISQSLDFRAEPRKFIALLLVLEELSYREWGFVPGIDPYFKISSSDGSRWKPSIDIFEGRSLVLRIPDGLLTLHFKETLWRHHGLIGRGTCVIHAAIQNPPQGWESVVAVKINSPASTRTSETEFLKVARNKATREAKWVLDHLPKILYHEDLDNASRRKLSAFFRAASKEDVYELRALRLIVFDELRPIIELTKADELETALRGIFKCYEWLYKEARILHRDISLYNLMYRRKEGKLSGVLNDFDLATLIDNPSPSSKQRTGTKPYMACELLAEEGVIHSYRHDLESLFYVILILTTHFQNGEEIENPPLTEWFSLNSRALSAAKYQYIGRQRLPSPTPPYAGFMQWLKPMCAAFADGFHWRGKNENCSASELETLGGNVTFNEMTRIFELKI